MVKSHCNHIPESDGKTSHQSNLTKAYHDWGISDPIWRQTAQIIFVHPGAESASASHPRSRQERSKGSEHATLVAFKRLFFFPKTGHSLSVRGIGNRSLGAIPAGSPTKLVQLSQKCGWIWISEIMGVPTCSNHPKENDLIRIPMLVNVGLFWVS